VLFLVIPAKELSLAFIKLSQGKLIISLILTLTTLPAIDHPPPEKGFFHC
jgi:hypothetical protein